MSIFHVELKTDYARQNSEQGKLKLLLIALGICVFAMKDEIGDCIIPPLTVQQGNVVQFFKNECWFYIWNMYTDVHAGNVASNCKGFLSNLYLLPSAQ